MIMFILLDKGIPWDVIQTMSSSDVEMVLGVEAALKQKQQEDHEAMQRAANSKIGSTL